MVRYLSRSVIDSLLYYVSDKPWKGDSDLLVQIRSDLNKFWHDRFHAALRTPDLSPYDPEIPYRTVLAIFDEGRRLHEPYSYLLDVLTRPRENYYHRLLEWMIFKIQREKNYLAIEVYEEVLINFVTEYQSRENFDLTLIVGLYDPLMIGTRPKFLHDLIDEISRMEYVFSVHYETKFDRSVKALMQFLKKGLTSEGFWEESDYPEITFWTIKKALELIEKAYPNRYAILKRFLKDLLGQAPKF